MKEEAKDFKEKLLNEMSESERNSTIWSILRVEDNLRTIYLSSFERAIKSLFLLNAGGVVTILAYIYRANTFCATTLLSVSLLAFLLGLLLAFILVIIDFFDMLGRVNRFNTDVKKFLIDKNIPFNGIVQFKESKDGQISSTKIKIRIGLISAGCVVIGIMFGLLGYFLS